MNTDIGEAEVTKPDTLEPYISLREAARILNISTRQLVRLTQPPEQSRLQRPYVRVPVHYVGQTRKFLPSELKAWRKLAKDAA